VAHNAFDKDRHAKLNDTNEDYWRGKNEHKPLVSELRIADHEIGRLEWRIRAAAHRMAKMTKQQGSLQLDASSKVALEQRKISTGRRSQEESRVSLKKTG
jgi:hypothetical protein